jgi:tellurite resistance protein TehA-like permease
MTTELARLQNFGPNWFASVMGTGIVATAGVTLPVHVPGLRGFSHIVCGWLPPHCWWCS